SIWRRCWNAARITATAMSNATWVCFECRKVVRRSTSPKPVVTCPQCRGSCYCLGRKVPVPPHEKVEAWRKLRDAVRSAIAETAVTEERRGVRHRHRIEQEIAKLEALPENSSRKALITKLRRELGGG